ncbi:unnamed protein product [Effrenium voratum]|nr:unnamed protein product [Effrenium voratum]
MHNFDVPRQWWQCVDERGVGIAPPRIMAQPEKEAREEGDDLLEALEVRSCTSFDHRSESDTDDFKDFSPEKTTEKIRVVDEAETPEGKARDAMKPSEAKRLLVPKSAEETEDETKEESCSDKAEDDLADKLRETVLQAADTKQADTKQADTKQADTKQADTQQTDTKQADTKQADTKQTDTKQAATKQADTKPAEIKQAETKVETKKPVMPALMLSRSPSPGLEAGLDMSALVKSEVSAQIAALQEEMADLRASVGMLQQLRGEEKAVGQEDLAEIRSSVKRELHDVQEVVNGELKDLTSSFRAEFLQMSQRVAALDEANAQLSQTIAAVSLDSSAARAAFEEVRPAISNLAGAQSALGSAQRESEKQLNACILRQRSDALALNARVKDMESGWRGFAGCFCKRRRPAETPFRPSEFAPNKLEAQQIPVDSERQRPGPLSDAD